MAVMLIMRESIIVQVNSSKEKKVQFAKFQTCNYQ